MRVFISAFRTEFDIKENMERHKFLGTLLVEYNWQEIEGCYGGVKELSYMVQTRDIEGLLAMARVFNQDCILVVDGLAKLLYPCGKVEAIGVMREIDGPIGDYSKVGDRFYSVN